MYIVICNTVRLIVEKFTLGKLLLRRFVVFLVFTLTDINKKKFSRLAPIFAAAAAAANSAA